MVSFNNKVLIFLAATRAYSLPISVMSWLVPFLYASLSGGNIYYGFISLIGIIILHLATNIFDDAVDYYREKSLIESGAKNKFDFQEGKCSCIFEGKLTLKNYFITAFILFFISLVFAIIFLNIYGLKLLFIIIPCALICISYPILGCLGLGEILVSVVFSPLIYSGVYFIMIGGFSLKLLLLSIATGLLAVSVLHNHMLLDYAYDTSNRKITLCTLLGSEKKAWILLLIIIISAYITILFCVLSGKFSYYYLLPFLSFPQAVFLLRKMLLYINNYRRNDFLYNFKLPQNLLTSFTILLCISIAADKCL